MNKNEDISNWLIEAIIKEYNIPVGSDIDIEEYILMHEKKKKRNKKYYKTRLKEALGEIEFLRSVLEKINEKIDFLEREAEAEFKSRISAQQAYNSAVNEINELKYDLEWQKLKTDSYKYHDEWNKLSPATYTTGPEISNINHIDFSKPKAKTSTSRWWKWLR